MTEQEQAKLTLTKVEEILSDWQDSEQDGWKVGNVVVTKSYYERILRALSASQTALRQARSDLIAAGMFDSAKEVEAALLDQGDGDAARP